MTYIIEGLIAMFERLLFGERNAADHDSSERRYRTS